MAKVRIGFSTHFEIENELAGIGTDNPTNTKQVLGNIHATNAKAVGITTITTPFEGFADTKLSLQGSAGAKQHTTSGEIIIEGTVDVSTGSTFTSGPENLTVTDNFTLPGISDDKPSVGETRFNENLAALEFYTGVEWRAVNYYVDMGNRGGRAVLLGGNHNPASAAITDIGAFNITTGGGETIFGELAYGSNAGAAFGSATRGITSASTSPTSNTITYVTIPSLGDSILFGDLTSVAYRMGGSGSSSTRGIWLGGRGAPGGAHNIIQYVQIQTLGNALDFGDLLTTGRGQGCNINSTTRVFCCGNAPYNDEIQYVNTASTGNAIDFGNQIYGGGYQGGCSNSIRGVIYGGYQGPSATFLSNQKQYITMASDGNAVEFGDMTQGLGDGQAYVYSASTQIRGCILGGFDNSASPLPSRSTVDAFNFASKGEVTVIGDLSEGKRDGGCTSDSHGGLGGF